MQPAYRGMRRALRAAALCVRATLAEDGLGASCRIAAYCPRLRHAPLHTAAPSLSSSASGTRPLGASGLQVRVSAKVLRALCTALNTGSLSSRFMTGSGLSFLEVRMSPDMRRAYVLWTALPGHEERMERELARSAVPLRSAVATLVGLKHTPALHFRRSVVTEEATRMEEAWTRLDREREEMSELKDVP